MTSPAPAQAAAIPPAPDALPLTLTIRLGTARMTIGEMTTLNEGSLLTLGGRADAPLEVCIDDRVVALGELVEGEDGTLSVRLTEMVP